MVWKSLKLLTQRAQNVKFTETQIFPKHLHLLHAQIRSLGDRQTPNTATLNRRKNILTSTTARKSATKSRISHWISISVEWKRDCRVSHGNRWFRLLVFSFRCNLSRWKCAKQSRKKRDCSHMTDLQTQIVAAESHVKPIKGKGDGCWGERDELWMRMLRFLYFFAHVKDRVASLNYLNT